MPSPYMLRWIRMMLWRAQRFVKYRVLHVDDTPHRIALGVGLGFFLTWLPLIGAQTVLVLVLCTVLKANKVVGLPFVWLSNPLTIIPIYYPSYWLGVRIIPKASVLSLGAWRAMVAQVFDADQGFIERALGFWRFAWGIAAPLWVGSVLFALVVGGMTYWLTYTGVVRYRRRMANRKPRARLVPRRRAVL